MSAPEAGLRLGLALLCLCAAGAWAYLSWSARARSCFRSPVEWAVDLTLPVVATAGALGWTFVAAGQLLLTMYRSTWLTP